MVQPFNEMKFFAYLFKKQRDTLIYHLEKRQDNFEAYLKVHNFD